jgi:hypothetical protein
MSSTGRATLVTVIVLAGSVSCADNTRPPQLPTPPPSLQGPLLPQAFLIPPSPSPAATAARATIDSLLCAANSLVAAGRPFFDLLPAEWETNRECFWNRCSGATCLGLYRACPSNRRWNWTYGLEDSTRLDHMISWVAYEASADADNRSGGLRIYEPFGTKLASLWGWNQSSPPGAWQWEFFSASQQFVAVFGSVDHDAGIPYRFLWRDRTVRWDASLDERHGLREFLVTRHDVLRSRISWSADGAGYWNQYDAYGALVDSASWGPSE